MTARNPTFVQVGVDATHIELIEGESSAGLMPLVDVAGRLKARVLDFGHSCDARGAVRAGTAPAF